MHEIFEGGFYFGGFWLFVFAFYMFARYYFESAQEWVINYCLKRIGRTTEAYLIDLYMDAKEDGTWICDFLYYLNGVEYRSNQKIGNRTQNLLTRTDTFPINYLPRKPAIARLSGDYADQEEYSRNILWAILCTLAIPPLLPIWGLLVAYYMWAWSTPVPKRRKRLFRYNNASFFAESSRTGRSANGLEGLSESTCNQVHDAQTGGESEKPATLEDYLSTNGESW